MGVKRYWRYSQEKMRELIAEGRVVQTKPERVPRYNRYLDEMPGVPLQNIWDDIKPVQSQSGERLGYPTQKPVTFLEHIIQVSSNPGDLVLDPFCGCSTALHASQKLGRNWTGIDITHLAISQIESRLKSAFTGLSFEVCGTPKDLEWAR
ncbi:DNA methyltransferase [Kamptonema formosum]|uniref:DNA methyltransferase n=1 Tax=Kamptonema formosum TaxID=331992 RepID=UPI00034A32B2|nr:site-specific DNA-methyltransferase [Oscillatoria sp. PCC 10802]